MQILALEPYYGGSHRALLDGWMAHSRHRWQLLGLPAHHWKWRMRHGALSLAAEVNRLLEQGHAFDLVLASDMLNLAEFAGLVPAEVSRLPRVAYFHENQLTYPDRFRGERDYHYAFTNFSTAMAATQVWFNSGYHRDEFYGAMRDLLSRMPDYRLHEELAQAQQKSVVCPPGIELPSGGVASSRHEESPLHIVWAARWEHDKAPETLHAALQQLQQQGTAFRLSVLGESFRDTPAVMQLMAEQFAASMVHWGYQATRREYWQALAEADVFVSTAIHEFFGLSAVEAVAAGAYPVLPHRLAYPEVFGLAEHAQREQYFYDGTAHHLAHKLSQLAGMKAAGQFPGSEQASMYRVAEQYSWQKLAARYDHALEVIVSEGG